ncbi:hypothetical protein PIROE2DRAFT_18248, partial [Piromyces sp. E2]
VKDVHRCNIKHDCINKNDNDNYRQSTEIFLIDGDTTVTVNDSIFENIYGHNGIIIKNNNIMNLDHVIFKDCNFQRGLVKIHQSKFLIGQYYFNNTQFINMHSQYGSIIHILELYGSTAVRVTFENSKFENNTASVYGGVFYSETEFADRFINFIDCEFINNKAMIGDIAYSYNLKSEPNITNIDVLKENPGNFATNPTSVKLNENAFHNISIYSGQRIPEEISCSIYDDYDNKIIFNSDSSRIHYDEFMFFNIEINDTYNAELIGQSQSYCWSDSCLYPPLK